MFNLKKHVLAILKSIAQNLVEIRLLEWRKATHINICNIYISTGNEGK